MQKKKTKKEAVVHNKDAVVWNVLSRIAWQLQCIYTVSDYWVLQDEIDGSWGWWCLPSADLFMANRRLQHPVNGELSQHAVCFTFWRTVWVVEEHETWFFFFFVSVCDCLKISSSSLSTLSVYWALGTLRTINQAVNNIQRGQFCHCQPRVMALALIAPKGAAEDIIHIRQNAGLVYNVQIWLIHL